MKTFFACGLIIKEITTNSQLKLITNTMHFIYDSIFGENGQNHYIYCVHICKFDKFDPQKQQLAIFRHKT